MCASLNLWLWRTLAVWFQCGGWGVQHHQHRTSVIKFAVFHNEMVSPEKLVFSSTEPNILIDEVCIASIDLEYRVQSVNSQQQTRPGETNKGRGGFSEATSGLFAASRCLCFQVSPTSRQVGFRPRMPPSTSPKFSGQGSPSHQTLPIGR